MYKNYNKYNIADFIMNPEKYDRGIKNNKIKNNEEDKSYIKEIKDRERKIVELEEEVDKLYSMHRNDILVISVILIASLLIVASVGILSIRLILVAVMGQIGVTVAYMLMCAFDINSK